MVKREKETPCPECGARNPNRNGHHFGCKKGRDKGGKK